MQPRGALLLHVMAWVYLLSYQRVVHTSPVLIIKLVVIFGIPNDIDISKPNPNSLSWLLPCYCSLFKSTLWPCLPYSGGVRMVMLVLVSECCGRSSCSSMA